MKKDLFDLLKEFIIKNADELECVDDNGSISTDVKFKGNNLAKATIEGQNTLSIEYEVMAWDENDNPCDEVINIISCDEYYDTEELEIKREDGKIKIEMNYCNYNLLKSFNFFKG